MMDVEVPPSQTIYVRNLNERTKKEELKKHLYSLFSPFGQILDVVCMKTMKMRGQAFIVFNDVSSASSALRQMQGCPVFGRPIEVQFARGKSFAIAELDGTLEETKRKRDEDKETKKNAPKRQATEKTAPKVHRESAKVVDVLPPHNILFLQNLAEDTTQEMLTSLFERFPGFKEVRVVPGKHDIAFVEFENELQSAVAKDNLQNFKISSTNEMKITFSKK